MKIIDYTNNARHWQEFSRDDVRVKKTSEVFTPSKVCIQMCDDYTINHSGDWRGDMCDPACGSGNLLSEMLLRKVLYYSDKRMDDIDAEIPLYIHHKALSEIYGVDIMADNIEAVTRRLWADKDSDRFMIGDFLQICAEGRLFCDKKEIGLLI